MEGLASFLVSAVIWIAVYGLTKKSGTGGTEANLGKLIRLSKDTADWEPKNPLDWHHIASRSVELTSEAKTYCSLTVLKDLSEEPRKAEDFVKIHWRLDFVRPDRFHVAQTAGGDFDQWVTIGKQNYQNSGLWIQTEDGRHDRLNESLLVDNILEIVRNEESVSSGIYRYLGQRYLLLEYNALALRKHPRGFLEACTDLSEGKCQIHVWISLDTDFLVKNQIIVQGKTREGEPANAEVHQVFTSYNERVKVEPPPWLNGVPGSKGTFTVVNTEVPILNHHN